MTHTGVLSSNLGSDPGIHITQVEQKEIRILCLLVQGHSIKMMAAGLKISENYVYLLLRQLRIRFGVQTNNAVVSRAIALGFVTVDGILLKNFHNVNS